MDGDFLGDSFLGEKLKELFFFAGAVATPPRATSQAWAAAWPLRERPRERRRRRLRRDAGEARGRRRDGQQGARDLDHLFGGERGGRFAAAAKPLFSAGDKRGRRALPRLMDDRVRRIRREADVCADGRQASS